MNATRTLPALAALLALAACDSTSTGPDGGDVGLVFRAAGTAASANAAPGAAADGPAADLVLSGGNGELTIDDLRLIVEEFELDGDDDVNRCEDAGGADDCEDFEQGPFFVRVPTDGGEIRVASADIPPGTYRELEFEVDDLDDDEPGEAALLAEIRTEVADWPRDASLMAAGTFRRRDAGGALGDPIPFRVFFEAEVEIETSLVPSLVVAEGGAPETVEVTVDPAALFRRGTDVLDLASLDGQLVQVEVEIEDGVFEARGDDD